MDRLPVALQIFGKLAQSGGVLRLALAVEIELQPLVRLPPVATVRDSIELGFEPFEAGMQTSLLLRERHLVGLREGRVEGGQHLPLCTTSPTLTRISLTIESSSGCTAISGASVASRPLAGTMMSILSSDAAMISDRSKTAKM